jgi:hypothetical protein
MDPKEFSELFVGWSRQWLCKDIGDHLGCMNTFEFEFLILDTLADMVMLNVYVFGARME